MEQKSRELVAGLILVLGGVSLSLLIQNLIANVSSILLIVFGLIRPSQIREPLIKYFLSILKDDKDKNSKKSQNVKGNGNISVVETIIVLPKKL